MHNLELLGQYEPAVFTAQAHSLSSLLCDLGNDGLINFTAQHHFDNIHGFRIRQSHPPNKCGFNSHTFQNRIDLQTAAMDHHRIQTDEFKQGDIPGKILL